MAQEEIPQEQIPVWNSGGIPNSLSILLPANQPEPEFLWLFPCIPRLEKVGKDLQDQQIQPLTESLWKSATSTRSLNNSRDSDPTIPTLIPSSSREIFPNIQPGLPWHGLRPFPCVLSLAGSIPVGPTAFLVLPTEYSQSSGISPGASRADPGSGRCRSCCPWLGNGSWHRSRLRSASASPRSREFFQLPGIYVSLAWPGTAPWHREQRGQRGRGGNGGRSQSIPGFP